MIENSEGIVVVNFLINYGIRYFYLNYSGVIKICGMFIYLWMLIIMLIYNYIKCYLK